MTPLGSIESLAGRVTIVTGAATGIGKATAVRLAGAGASVVVNHLDTPAAADAVAKQIAEDGGHAIVVAGDVGQRDEFERLFDAAADRFGSVDILVNNAAVATLVPIADATEAQIDTVLEVNVKGTLFGCQFAARRLTEGGRIINISSSTTGLALPDYGIYDMTKGAIEQITRILARELGPRSITVNAVSPGATETDSYRDGKDPAFIAELERISAFNRLGRVEEIADVIAFSPATRRDGLPARTSASTAELRDSMNTSLDQTVAVVITRRVHEHHAAQFEAVLREAISTASRQPGWTSAEVLCRPLTATHREYNIVYRFNDDERSRAWETSDARRKLPARVDALAVDADRQELTGMEAWFALPAGAAPPARWRMALLTSVGIWPLVTLVIGLDGETSTGTTRATDPSVVFGGRRPGPRLSASATTSWRSPPYADDSEPRAAPTLPSAGVTEPDDGSTWQDLKRDNDRARAGVRWR